MQQHNTVAGENVDGIAVQGGRLAEVDTQLAVLEPRLFMEKTAASVGPTVITAPQGAWRIGP